MIHGMTKIRDGRRIRFILYQSLVLVAFEIFSLSAVHGSCLTMDQVYEISGGNYPKHFKWKGANYSSSCRCRNPVSTSGISGDGFACLLGTVCRCGTYNGVPWMGVVKADDDNPQLDLGSSPRPMKRKDGFYLFFTEINELRRQLTCLSTNEIEEVRFECTTSANSIVTIHGGGGRSVSSIELFWEGELPKHIELEFVALYGGNDKAILEKELKRTTPRVGRRNKRFSIGPWKNSSHTFWREAYDIPAHHWITIQ